MKALLLLCSAAICLSAQQPAATPQPSQLLQLLQSPRLIDRAWGAHYIAALNAREHADWIVNELRSRPSPTRTFGSFEPTEEYSYVHVLLDALIQMELPVNGDLLVKFLPDFKNEVTILLTKNVVANSDLLLRLSDVEIGDGAEHWLAIQNALIVRSRHPAAILNLLRTVPIEHTLVLSNNPIVVVAGGPGGLRIGCGQIQLARGFPPTGVYTLTLSPQPGDVVLESGPTGSSFQTVYYRRFVIPTSKQIGWSETSSLSNRVDYKLQYLAHLSLQPIDQVRQAVMPSTTISWSSPEAFRQISESALALQKQTLQNLLFRIADATSGLSIEDIRTLGLQIRPLVDDHRETRGPSPIAGSVSVF